MNALTKDVVVFFALQLESSECSMVIKLILLADYSTIVLLFLFFSLLVVDVVGVTCCARCARWLLAIFSEAQQQQQKNFARFRRENGGIERLDTRTNYSDG